MQRGTVLEGMLFVHRRRHEEGFIDTILQKFAYPCATRYADFIGFSEEPHLKTLLSETILSKSVLGLIAVVTFWINGVGSKFQTW